MSSDRLNTSNGQASSEPATPSKARGKGIGLSRPSKSATVPSRASKGHRRKASPVARLQVTRWAHLYTGCSVVLSSLLNGWSACHHHLHPEEGEQSPHWLVVACAVLVSGIIPVLVWGLSQLAGWLVRAHQQRLALAAGIVGVGMLLLSVWHVSVAISLLTGQHLFLAVPLAIGIDCGLVVSELSAIMVSE